MPDEVIARDRWASFLARLSPMLEGQPVEVEVDSLGLGEQIAAEWVRVVGFSYDHKDDVFSLAVEGLDHVIQRPQHLAVRWQGQVLESLAITDADGALHLARFREPLAPPPVSDD